MNPASQTALQLRDIHLPAEPGFWPPAPGWWVLATLLLVLLFWTGRILLRRYRLQRQRQRILAMLDELEPGNEITTEKLAQISSLLRRLALMRYPHQQVASLIGTAWLHFLDESGGGGRFSHGPGQVLASGPYQSALNTDLDAQALSTLLRDWIKKNTEHKL